MWRLLSKISTTKACAMILTTHNMVECEAVCTRISMMKQGEFVCLGDNQHLRDVHGTGYLLEVAAKIISDVNGIKSFVQTSFPNALIVDEHATMLNYEIPRDNIPSLANAFKLLEERKQQLNIVDYTLSQSTLEQVFLKQIRTKATDEDYSRALGKPKHEPPGQNAGCWSRRSN